MSKSRAAYSEELNKLLETNFNWGRLNILDLERLTNAVRTRLLN